MFLGSTGALSLVQKPNFVSHRKENFSTFPFDYCSLRSNNRASTVIPDTFTPVLVLQNARRVYLLYYNYFNFLLSRPSLEGKLIQMYIKHFYISSLRNEIRTYTKNSNMPNVSSKVFRELNKIEFVNEYDVCIQIYIVLS